MAVYRPLLLSQFSRLACTWYRYVLGTGIYLEQICTCNWPVLWTGLCCRLACSMYWRLTSTGDLHVLGTNLYQKMVCTGDWLFVLGTSTYGLYWCMSFTWDRTDLNHISRSYKWPQGVALRKEVQMICIYTCQNIFYSIICSAVPVTSFAFFVQFISNTTTNLQRCKRDNCW